MPPSKSGIADYSAALTGEMKKLAQMTVFESSFDSTGFRPDDYDVALYHLGNNPWHEFAYETALRNPGVTVMHEANLHHLIADLTIKRGDWDGYFAECELNGGAEALEYARTRVRTLQVGPDYEGVAMTRRVLQASRGLVVHSEFVARQMREQGFARPIEVIPHGAWIPHADRNAARQELGLDETTPLVGAFGYLKPYKRIAQSLRALRRLVKLDPRVKMILVGEPHPEFHVEQLIGALGLREHVRVIGFAPIGKFVEYMGACDIILNLRYPTVGETSGSLQRALGLGKAVVVSDVGAFAELPDEICVKAPAGPEHPEEEDLIFEYLNVLVSRPDLARAMGRRAKEWVERECSWMRVAGRYVEFLECFRDGCVPRVLEIKTTKVEESAEPGVEREPEGGAIAVIDAPAEMPSSFVESVEPEAVGAWVAPEAKAYAAQHTSRFVRTLEMTPAGDASKAILEMGAYMQITPALHYKLGYGTVRGCYYGEAGRTDHKCVTSETGETFECEVDLFDAEKDPFPYADASFDTVLCCELIEHLPSDPMHMMAEINRILKPGGHVLVTTPNIGSMRAISAILQGYHPSFFPAYIRPRKPGDEAEARHNREYVPMEVEFLLRDAGFEIVRLETGEFLDEPHPEFAWVEHLLQRYLVHKTLRGDGIYGLGRKTGPVKARWPSWLYA